MLNILEKLHHEITVWRQTVGDYGAIDYERDDEPMAGRWNETSELFMDANGREVVSRAKVILEGDVTVGDYLYWGTSTADDPREVSGAFKVRRFQRTPDLNAVQFLRTAFL